MDYMTYIAQLNYSVLQIVYWRRKHVKPPSGCPEWLWKMLKYYFAEFSNSKDELTEILEKANLSTSFEKLLLKLNNSNAIQAYLRDTEIQKLS